VRENGAREEEGEVLEASDSVRPASYIREVRPSPLAVGDDHLGEEPAEWFRKGQTFFLRSGQTKNRTRA
jgi:hypothetical protein